MVVRRILTLAAWCATAPALASPRSDATTGRAVFTGAATPHAAAIALNPSALGLWPIDEVYLAVTGALDQLQIDLDKLDIASGDLAPGSRVRDIGVSPGAMFAFVYHAGERVTLGFEARTNPAESLPDNRDALRYHTLGDGERDWLASVGVSFKATSELFFGASLSHQNTLLRLRWARDTALEAGDTAQIGTPAADEIYDIDVRAPWVSTSNLRLNIGLVYEFMRDVWIGVAYHTPPGLGIQTELAGHVTMTRAPRDQVEGEPTQIRGASVVEIQFPASVDAEVRARLPFGLDLHVGGRWEDLSRMQAYDVRTYGSTLRALGIPEWTQRPRGMHDAFAVWGGVEQFDVGQDWLFGARIGLETSAVSDHRTSPVTVSPSSATFDVGVQRRLSHRVVAQLSYGLQFFPKVNVLDSAFDPLARMTCADAQFDYSTPACQAVREGYALATAAGQYDRLQHALRLSLRYEIP